MRDKKLPQVVLEIASLLITRHKIVCFVYTSFVDIDCARLSLCQAQLLNQGSIETEIRVFVTHVRLTLYLESKSLSIT